MTLNESVVYVFGPESVIFNGSCLFHFTYSRAGRVTWIRRYFAHFAWMLSEWHTHSHTTTFVWFMRKLMFFGSFFFSSLTLSVLFGFIGTYIDVCLRWAANKLMWCWILDEEFMFYARIDSLNRNQSKLPYIIEGLCTRHQFSSIQFIGTQSNNRFTLL